MWPTEQPTLTDGASGLRLRPLRTSDLSEVLRACQDPDIQHFTLVPVPYGPEDARGFLEAAGSGWEDRRAAIFAIADGSDALIGACSIQDVDLEQAVAGIGYWVAPWGRGRGAARQAVQLVTAWAHGELGLGRLVMEIEPGNVASMVSAQAAGFRSTGRETTASVKGEERIFQILEHRIDGPSSV